MKAATIHRREDNTDWYLYLGKNAYHPSSFVIIYDLPIIDMNDMEGEVFSQPHRMALFIHEYIHFLQDISTRYGLIKASNLYVSTKEKARVIKESKKESFNVPQILDPRKVTSATYLNYNTFPDYLGNGVIDEFKYKKVKVTSYIIAKKHLIEEVTVYLDIENIGRRKVILGGEILCESMAYIAEKNYADAHAIKLSETSEYPYMLCNKLIEHIYPELNNDPMSVFLIIDQCLYRYYNPGPHFIHIVNYLKQKGYCQKSEAEKYSCLDEYFKAKIMEEENYQVVLNEVLNNIHTCFVDSGFDETLKWLYILYIRSRSLRTSDPYCFKGFMDSKGLVECATQIYKHILGLPLVSNDIHEAVLQVPSNSLTAQEIEAVHPEYFTAVYCLNNVFQNGKKRSRCLLDDFCRESEKCTGEKIDNTHCDEPWLKYQDAVNNNKSGLCAFATLWKHWGLENQYPAR